MKPTTRKQREFRRRLLHVAVASCFTGSVLAAPVNPTVVRGGATFNNAGSTLTVTNTPGTIVNWQSFGINSGETVRFVQQSSASTILNRVTGGDMTRILGTLQSNGKVFLVNPNGIFMGQGAVIDVAGLLATSLNITDDDFANGKLKFNADRLNPGSVTNAGSITTPNGGFVYLVAPQVENSGIINTPSGEAILAAGHSVELVDSTDPALRVQVKATSDDINLSQLMTSSNGNVFSVLNSGRISANTAVVGQNGKVQFRSAGSVQTTTTSIVEAKGDINMDGGLIRGFADTNGIYAGQFDASGRNGGFIETSGSNLNLSGIQVAGKALAPTGRAGKWLLDPVDISITHVTGTGTPVGSPFAPTSDNTITDRDITATLESGLSLIVDSGGTCATTCGNGDIVINDGVIINPNLNNQASVTLTLDAANDIVFLGNSSPAGITFSNTTNNASFAYGLTIDLIATGGIRNSSNAVLNLQGGSGTYANQSIALHVSGGNTFDNYGSFQMTGNSVLNLDSSNPATFVNHPSATFTVNSTNQWPVISNSGSSNGVIDNQGVMNIFAYSNASYSTSLEAQLNSTGTINVSVGSAYSGTATLSVQNMGTIEGALNLASTTVFLLSENHGLSEFLNTSIIGSGTLDLTSSALTAGDVVFTGNVSVSGVATNVGIISDLSADNLSLTNGAGMDFNGGPGSLTVSGALTLDSGSHIISSTGALDIYGGSVSVTNGSFIALTTPSPTDSPLSIQSTSGNLLVGIGSDIYSWHSLNLVSAGDIHVWAGSSSTTSSIQAGYKPLLYGGSVNIQAAGKLKLDGGSGTGASAFIYSYGGTIQHIYAGGGIELTGGSGADSSARIHAEGPVPQRIISGGDMKLTGGSGTNSFAVIETGYELGSTFTAGGYQDIFFSGVGSKLEIKGGSGTNSFAAIHERGANQWISGADYTPTFTFASTGVPSAYGGNVQKNPLIKLSGGSVLESEAGIEIENLGAGSQVVYGGSILLQSGTVSGAYIGAGVAYTGSGATAASQDVRVTKSAVSGADGLLKLQGGSGTDAMAAVGSDNRNTNISVYADSVLLSGSGGGGAMIGSIGYQGVDINGDPLLSGTPNDTTVYMSLTGGSFTMSGSETYVGSEKGLASVSINASSSTVGSVFELGAGHLGTQTSNQSLLNSSYVGFFGSFDYGGYISQGLAGSIRSGQLDAHTYGGAVLAGSSISLLGDNLLSSSAMLFEHGKAGVYGNAVLNLLPTDPLGLSGVILPTSLGVYSGAGTQVGVIGTFSDAGKTWNIGSAYSPYSIAQSTNASIFSTVDLALTGGVTLTGTNSISFGAGGTLSFGGSYNGTGTVDLIAPTITLTGGTITGSDISLKAAGSLSGTSTITGTGAVTLGGSFLSLSGSVTGAVVKAGASDLLQLSGSLIGSESVTLGGKDITVGGSVSSSSVKIAATSELTVTGTVSASDVGIKAKAITVNGGDIFKFGGKLNIETIGDIFVTNFGNITGGPDVDNITVGGKIYLDYGGRVNAISAASIYLTFPALSTGGYVVDGIEGGQTTGPSTAGFYADGSPAVLGTSLHVTYGTADSSLLSSLITELNSSTESLFSETLLDGDVALIQSEGGGTGEDEEEKKDEPKECG